MFPVSDMKCLSESRRGSDPTANPCIALLIETGFFKLNNCVLLSAFCLFYIR